MSPTTLSCPDPLCPRSSTPAVAAPKPPPPSRDRATARTTCSCDAPDLTNGLNLKSLKCVSDLPPRLHLAVHLYTVALITPVFAVVLGVLRQEHHRRAQTSFLTTCHQLVPELRVDAWPARDTSAAPLVTDVAVESGLVGAQRLEGKDDELKNSHFSYTCVTWEA